MLSPLSGGAVWGPSGCRAGAQEAASSGAVRQTEGVHLGQPDTWEIGGQGGGREVRVGRALFREPSFDKCKSSNYKATHDLSTHQ